ncbi:MAG: DMT family transporter [Oscillospiraceae bacterium]|nr:DMT family transporter [Oscillospiraceae bacterium]
MRTAVRAFSAALLAQAGKSAAIVRGHPHSLPADLILFGWGAVVFTNLVAAVGGTLFFTIGIRYTDAQIAAIASTLEPITSILVGIVLLGEPSTPRSLVGSAMILTAVILLSVFDGKEEHI